MRAALLFSTSVLACSAPGAAGDADAPPAGGPAAAAGTAAPAGEAEPAAPRDVGTDEEEAAPMDELCRREIEDLHRFFQDWFRGEIEGTEQRLARLTRVLDPEFRIVWPDGTLSERAAVVERVAASHGASWNQEPPFRIAIAGYRAVPLSDELCLATYEEWQTGAEGTRGRLSTALFRRDADAPHGVRWLHVHETWLPAEEDGAGD